MVTVTLIAFVFLSSGQNIIFQALFQGQHRLWIFTIFLWQSIDGHVISG